MSTLRIEKIQRQKDILNQDFKWISVTMDKSKDWIESSYKLIEEIDNCLKEDYGKPKHYDLVMSQFQIWEETRKNLGNLTRIRNSEKKE